MCYFTGKESDAKEWENQNAVQRNTSMLSSSRTQHVNAK